MFLLYHFSFHLSRVLVQIFTRWFWYALGLALVMILPRPPVRVGALAGLVPSLSVRVPHTVPHSDRRADRPEGLPMLFCSVTVERAKLVLGKYIPVMFVKVSAGAVCMLLHTVPELLS